MTYNTPGVYVREIPTFPPSVAQVATAIPAFIGYTQEGYNGSVRVERINSLLEYESIFGTAPSASFSFRATNLTPFPIDVVLDSDPGAPQTFLTYYAVSLYFQNGGGACYIVSIGSSNTDKASPTLQSYLDGLNRLAVEDEPTLIVFPDAISLTNSNDYYTVAQQALSQCAELGDRFVILDIPKKSGTANPTDTEILAFRTGVSSDYLSYAAAYHPYLTTTLTHVIDESAIKVNAPSLFAYKVDGEYTITYSGKKDATPTVSIKDSGSNPISFVVTEANLTINTPSNKTAKDLDVAWKSRKDPSKDRFDISVPSSASKQLELIDAKPLTAVLGSFTWEQDPNGIKVSYVGQPDPVPKIEVKLNEQATGNITFAITGNTLEISLKAAQPASAIVSAWTAFNKEKSGFDISLLGNGTASLAAPISPTLTLQEPIALGVWKKLNTVLYSKIKTALANIPVVLPPSPAIAGIYARVDRDRGVWKTPANVPVLSVIAPVAKISDAAQDLLNVDATSGKSINAIRAFAGKGTLVWGGRTLAGNDNEWRYVSVRRLFITIEESARKASAFAVFEPNDATTWLKVKAMIESYLYGLWEQGALAGSKPESAFFVSVGLGKTMTPQDVLEGRMIVRIGIAAVRPAEFIILEFTHKLQEA